VGGPSYLGAIDLGATKVFSLVATPEGRILGKDRRPTFASRGPRVVLAQLEGSLRASLRRAHLSLRDLGAVGIASPGPIDLAAGVVHHPPNLPGWGALPLRRLMEERLGLPVVLENDATAAAVGEHIFGAGRGARHMVYVTVSTGIGGGIIVDGKPYRGKGGAAGELGHIILQVDGPLCGCGARGCVEALASGTAIARRARELMGQGRAPVLTEMAEGQEVTAALVAKAAKAGDRDCQALLEEVGRLLGLALASYANAFDPDVIVVGGGVTRAGPLFWRPARRTLMTTAMPQIRRGLRLLRARLGDAAGALGMVAIIGQEPA
jgi:glucokinase